MLLIDRKYENLPSEIAMQIFKQLPNQTQIACQYVCKSWYHPARQLFYSAVVTTGNEDISKLVYCLEHSSAGGIVKLLQINGSKGLNRDYLIRLISACANLQELQISSSALFLKWILEDNKRSISLKNLKVIKTLGRSSWRLTEQNSSYYLVAHKFRNSIDTLHIPCACSRVLDNNFGSTINYLSSFSKLKELDIIDGSMNNMIYFHELLSVCPRLKKLNMQLGHPLFDPSKKVIDRSTITKAYPTLHTIEFFMTRFSVDYMRYMMNRFVNMKKWTVYINQNNVDWIKNKEEIEQYLKVEYIPFIKKLQNSSLKIKMNGSSSIGDFFSNYSHLDKDTRIRSLFQIENSRSERTDILLETQRHRSSSAKYIFVKDFSFGSTELPFTTHLITYGSHIATLCIKLSSTVKRAIDLGSIVQQCPNSQLVEIDISQKQPREYLWSSLLEMYSSVPNIYWNNEEREVRSNDTNSNLLVLKMGGAMITATLLNSIAIGVPSLNKLSLINCSFEPVDIAARISRFNMSNLNLKELELDTCMFYYPKRQFTQVVITVIEGKKSNYYIFDKCKNDGGEFEHVSSAYFNEHCTTLKQSCVNEDGLVVLEFIFNTVETMKIHIGKYIQHQRIENILFFTS